MSTVTTTTTTTTKEAPPRPPRNRNDVSSNASLNSEEAVADGSEYYDYDPGMSTDDWYSSGYWDNTYDYYSYDNYYEGGEGGDNASDENFVNEKGQAADAAVGTGTGKATAGDHESVGKEVAAVDERFKDHRSKIALEILTTERKYVSALEFVLLVRI
ncbi:hypothetical protein HMI54_011989 [Coelomomyces lativittatus]|nr:hypothetical protein HMI54_011989 [Coelomomyces lativittatus]